MGGGTEVAEEEGRMHEETKEETGDGSKEETKEESQARQEAREAKEKAKKVDQEEVQEGTRTLGTSKKTLHINIKAVLLLF